MEPVAEGRVARWVTRRQEEGAADPLSLRDLTRAVPGECPCGRPAATTGIVGRSDDMFIVRGVNIYPSHIDEILSREKGVGSEFQIHLDHYEDGKDYMMIKVEREAAARPEEDAALAVRIERTIRKEMLVSGKVEIVDYQALPRTERKAKRVFDNRT